MPAPSFSLDSYVSAWNDNDLDRIVEHYADDARVTRSSVLVPWEGKEAVRQGIGNFLSAWEGLSVHPRNLVQDGASVAVVLSYSGTHAHEAELAPGDRLAPTGRQVAFDLAHFLTLDRDGRIVRDEGILDMLSLLGQCGAPPEVLARASLRESGGGRDRAQQPARR